MPRARSWRARCSRTGVASWRSSGCCCSLRSRLSTADGRLEQIEDARILVGPGIGSHEPVVLDRIRDEPPIPFAELDEALCEADAVLEVDVRVDHSVEDQKWV